jgi:hypothetical protein
MQELWPVFAAVTISALILIAQQPPRGRTKYSRPPKRVAPAASTMSSAMAP